jgi:energy-coupling factor transporter ATP-binding protein EcfA2
MRLIAVSLRGYKRFEDRAKLNLDAKLVALVGPNEAGKSTILQALRRLDAPAPILQQERTRASTPRVSAGDSPCRDAPHADDLVVPLFQGQTESAGSVQTGRSPKLRAESQRAQGVRGGRFACERTANARRATSARLRPRAGRAGKPASRSEAHSDAS